MTDDGPRRCACGGMDLRPRSVVTVTLQLLPPRTITAAWHTRETRHVAVAAFSEDVPLVVESGLVRTSSGC
jgi:hypothetical protein